MWSEPLGPWVCHSTDFVGDTVDRDRATGPWSGHRDFVYDLLRWRQPHRVVELGTHYGVSLFAMVQALRDAEAESQLHAVDTWEGDEHAGFYGQEVFDTFQRILEVVQGPDVTVHRCLFSDALSQFDDESLDLIHIDGLHTHEAAREDLNAWLPKLAPNGVVLMHDIDSGSGYGSADHWTQEVAARFPNVVFGHNFGLGVAFPKGAQGWDFLLSEEFDRWKGIYRQSAVAHERSVMVVDQALMIDERDQTMRDQALVIDERDQTMRDQAVMIDERDQTMRDQAVMIDERDQSIMSQTMMIDERDHLIERSEAEIAARDSAIGQLEAALRELENHLVDLEHLNLSPRRQVKALTRSVPATIRTKARVWGNRR